MSKRKAWKKTTTCSPGCGARLEFTEEDIKRRDADRDGAFVVIVCAVCKKEILIDASLIPS